MPGNPDKKPWLLGAAIVALALLAFQPVWRAGFIWDDDVYVSNDPCLRTVEGLQKIWKPGSTIQYYPLVFSSFWVEYHLWGTNPLGYHLVNVLLHAANALLLWQVLRKLALPGAWLAAAIFAIHPVTVESVVWITERKNVLSCFLYLLAALTWLRVRPFDGRAWDWRFYPLVVAAFLCALFSKTVTCSLPAALLLVAWWKTGRIDKRDVLAMAPLFVLGVLLGHVTVEMEHNAGAGIGSEWSLSFVQRCLVAGRVVWFYAGKLLWPRGLTFIYPRWHVDAGVPWQYAFLLAALAVLAVLWWLRAKIGRGPLVAVLFFGGTLFPALGFFDVYPFRFSFVADHFQYLACIGLIALAASVACRWFSQHGQRAGILAGAVVLALLGWTTWTQAHVYRDLETLWKDTIAKNPDCWMAHHNLGGLLITQGRSKEALHYSEMALKLQPDDPDILNNVGLELAKTGNDGEAAKYYTRAIEIAPKDSKAYVNLGVLHMRSDNYDDSIRYFKQALKANPADAYAIKDLALVENNLAWMLVTNGADTARAVVLARNACLATTNREPAYLDTLAAAYAANGQFPEAIGTEETAIALARSVGDLNVLAGVEAHQQSFRAGHRVF